MTIQADKVPSPHTSGIYLLTMVSYLFQEKDLQKKDSELTLQISSPWNPPATSKLPFTARVLT